MDKEQQYYQKLQQQRQKDNIRKSREKKIEGMVGKKSGQAAQKAAIASGVGAPLAWFAKKAGEKVGAKLYKNRKLIIIILIGGFIVNLLFVLFIIFLPVIALYVIACESTTGQLADLIGLISCP